MNGEQLEILRHALGCDEYGLPSWKRNYYHADSDANLSALVDAGMMVDHGFQQISKMHYYTVTDKGTVFVTSNAKPRPKLSRSKKRYMAWLNADIGISFGEWIKCGY